MGLRNTVASADKLMSILYVHIPFNPLPLLFKALLHEQRDCVFFQRAFKCVRQQERFRAFGPAWGTFKFRALWSVRDGKGLKNSLKLLTKYRI
jgi:hypothetical protein